MKIKLDLETRELTQVKMMNTNSISLAENVFKIQQENILLLNKVPCHYML